MVNKVELIGRLGADPEVRVLDNGNNLGKFSLCTTETWNDKQGVKQEETTWHNVAMFGKMAENAGRMLAKGSLVYVEGKIKTRTADVDGVTKYYTDVIARDFRILSDGKRNMQQQQTSQQQAPQQQAPQQQAPQQQAPQQQAPQQQAPQQQAPQQQAPQQQAPQQQAPQQQAPQQQAMVNTDDDLPF